MSTNEVQLSERLPMLAATEEVVQSNPVAPVVLPIETAVVVRKEEKKISSNVRDFLRRHTDANVIPEDNNQFIQVIRPLLVELIGTGLFILFGLWAACSGGGVLAAALSFGLALMAFAASFGHISGVHFNPAVTLGILIAGEMQPVMAILYIVMQLLGGLAAGGLVRLLLPAHALDLCKGGATLLRAYPSVNTTVNGVTQVVEDQVSIAQGIAIEFIATFVLVTIILMVTLDTKSKTGLAPLVIGFTLAVAILAIGAYTGGSLNPARSLGPAVFSYKWEFHYVYWIGPLVGAVVAGLLYRTVWAHHDRRMFAKRVAKH